MEFLDKNTIKLDKVESELDKLVFDFIKIFEKHAKYVIISGYVSILFGRSRATEDVDLFIEHISKERFKLLCEDLLKNSYYCLNADDPEEMYDHLKSNLALRFAKENTIIPNFEIKFAKNIRQEETLLKPLKVILPSGTILISSIEQQIAYKKFLLKSDKDIEDAAHLEKLFEGKLDNNLIQHYKKLINSGL